MPESREERRQQLRAELITRLERVRGDMSDAEFDNLVTSLELTAARFAEIDARPVRRPTDEPLDRAD
jgi:hypothetical protein